MLNGTVANYNSLRTVLVTMRLTLTLLRRGYDISCVLATNIRDALFLRAHTEKFIT